MGVDCRGQARRRRRTPGAVQGLPAASTTMRRFAGIEVVDRYTLRIRLVRPDFNFAYVLAMPATAAVAREVVEAYRNDLGAHPVGTGPYRLVEYKRSSRIVLEANAGYRGEVFAEQPSDDPADTAIARHLAGKTLPLIGRIEISVIVEDQSRWLAFLNRQLDYMQQLPPSFADQALQDGKLRPEFAARAIRQEVLVRPNTWWNYFNMEDPVVGGYTPDKIALRRAMGMGFNTEEFIRVIFHGRALAGAEPIAAGHRGVRSEAADDRADIRPGDGAGAARQVRLQGSRR